jgi:hypothetical protein
VVAGGIANEGGAWVLSKGTSEIIEDPYVVLSFDIAAGIGLHGGSDDVSETTYTPSQ